MDIEHLIKYVKEIATEKQYKAWIERQPSCISGHFSEWDPIHGEWRNIACHIRRVKWGSGTGQKNEWFYTVPMTNKEHQLQHNNGESSLLSKERFENLVFIYLHNFLREHDK